jgi:hypothetical protein
VPLIRLPLTAGQPIVPVHIGVSERLKKQLQAAGALVPSPVRMNLIVDTGASLSALDKEMIAPLKLPPSGAVQMRPVSISETISHPTNGYHVSLLLPAPECPALRLDALLVFEGAFRHQGIDGLLGRDVLAHCLFVYDAPAGCFTLAR